MAKCSLMHCTPLGGTFPLSSATNKSIDASVFVCSVLDDSRRHTGKHTCPEEMKGTGERDRFHKVRPSVLRGKNGGKRMQHRSANSEMAIFVNGGHWPSQMSAAIYSQSSPFFFDSCHIHVDKHDPPQVCHLKGYFWKFKHLDTMQPRCTTRSWASNLGTIQLTERTLTYFEDRSMTKDSCFITTGV